MNRIILSVGSNVNPTKNIKKAKEILSQEQTLIRESRFRQTKPVGLVGQPDFLNGAFYIVTSLDRVNLKKYLNSLEKRLGRRKLPGGVDSNVIDLDIIVFNDVIVDNDYEDYEFVSLAVDEIAKVENLTLHHSQ